MTSPATGRSQTVRSNQQDCHPKLAAVVRRHLDTPFRRPVAAHNREAFARAAQWLTAQRKPLILDSFCGTGESSRHLARAFPDHAIIGIDKSAHRLARHHPDKGRDNYLLLRAETEDFWRLALEHDWRPRRHFLLYPNPWPKSAQLQRRCHGSPLFPVLLALGGELELRSNWRLYLDEFCQALAIAGLQASVEDFQPRAPITAFERKYAASGHTLWRCRTSLSRPLTDGL